jgi:hypothetical protein
VLDGEEASEHVGGMDMHRRLGGGEREEEGRTRWTLTLDDATLRASFPCFPLFSLFS